MTLFETAQEICAYLERIPQVRSCTLYGSLARGTADSYSDIDLEIDVSGSDNGQFLLALPALMSEKYPVVFCDYAPSLAPEKYVVSIAVSEENPFLVIDLACIATPHCTSVTPQLLREKNNAYEHTLKLFTANLKHFRRGTPCEKDIAKMYARTPGCTPAQDERSMLRAVYAWLRQNAMPRHFAYVDALRAHLPE